jgi:hypothetical protein
VDSDHSLAALLFCLVLYGFIIYPLARDDGRASALVALAFSVVLVLGVMASTHHKAARMGMVTLAGVAFTSHWLHFFVQQHTIKIVATTASAIFFGTLSWLIIGRVFRGGSITIYRIYGAIAAYLLLGIFWGELYMLVYFLDPNSFTPLATVPIERSDIFELMYFSYVTLTTVGFGDITPLHPLARSLATLEALVGQLYPAILLARLVTLYKER